MINKAEYIKNIVDYGKSHKEISEKTGIEIKDLKQISKGEERQLSSKQELKLIRFFIRCYWENNSTTTK